MRVAPALVVECVENRERRRAFLDSKPGDRARFGVDQRQRRFKEIRDFLFLTRLGLKRNVQRNLGHRSLLAIMIDTDGENATYKSLSGLAVEANQSSVERNGSGTLPQRCAKFTLPTLGLRRHGSATPSSIASKAASLQGKTKPPSSDRYRSWGVDGHCGGD